MFLLQNGDLDRKPASLDKAKEEDGVTEEHVKLAPGWRKPKMTQWRNQDVFTVLLTIAI